MSDGRRVFTESDRIALRTIRDGADAMINRCRNALLYSAQTPFLVSEIEQMERQSRELVEKINGDLGAKR